MTRTRFLADAGLGLAVMMTAASARGSGGELQSPSFRIPAYTINGGSGDGNSAYGSFHARGHVGELGDAMHESPSFILLPGFSGQLKWLKEGLLAPPPVLPILSELPVLPWQDPGYYAPSYFGGTWWAADSLRWETLPGGTWTFDSGIGSSYLPVNPAKAFGLHTTMEGWIGLDASGGVGGDWSDIVSLYDLPSPLTSCACALTDTVLVFDDLFSGGHGQYQYNFAISPWIDLKRAGSVGRSGKSIQFDAYMDMPVQNYVMLCTASQWGPDPAGAASGQWLSPLWKTFAYYPAPSTVCTPNGCPVSIDLSWVIPPQAEEVRIGLGIANLCRFFSDCTGATNASPYIDNVRFVVHGDYGAPPVAALSVDLPMDSFPINAVTGINPTSPGRVDSPLLLGAVYPGPNTDVGDTLVVRGTANHMEVYVEFAAVGGPFIAAGSLSSWLNSHALVGTRFGVNWYQARMDTAEVGGAPYPGCWMTTYHESDPNFNGPDTALDPGDPGHLANDIFPDNLFTPGSRLMLFYKARYTGGGSWSTFPDTAGGRYLEMEVLPSSMSPDSTFNCVLYVNHQERRDVKDALQAQLHLLFPDPSYNFENTHWDRFDVAAASSEQAGLGRPPGCTYGAAYTQLGAYQTVIWNTGSSTAFGLQEYDAAVLANWLSFRAATSFGGGLYLNGDNLASSMTREAARNPSAIELLEKQCGVELVCSSVSHPYCPVPTGPDPTDCWPVFPEPGALVALPSRPVAIAAAGLGCGESATLDVLAPSSQALGTAVPDEGYLSPLFGSQGLSAVAHDVPQFGYRTVVDGLSLHHRVQYSICDPGLAASWRLFEVTSWFATPSGCGVPQAIGVPGNPTPPPVTMLLPASVNPVTRGDWPTFRFTLAAPGSAILELYDLQGRLVRSLFRGDAPDGLTEVGWDGRDYRGSVVPVGVYFYRLVASGRDTALKLVVLNPGS